MPDPHTIRIRDLREALDRIDDDWPDKVRAARHLLTSDSFERLVTLKLFEESVGALLEERTFSEEPTVVFLDWTGGGDGTRASSRLIELVGRKTAGARLLHVAFSTPSQGLGTLVRSSLVRTGAKQGVVVDVLAVDKPIAGLAMSDYDARYLFDGCDLVVTFTSGGGAGIFNADNRLACPAFLERSHLALLSFPDPESIVSELSALKETASRDAVMDSLRLWVQMLSDDGVAEQGMSLLGEGGDAEDRFWILLDNAKRGNYQVMVEPVHSGVSCGAPLFFPCKAAIERHLGDYSTVARIVPAGSRLAAVAHGKTCSN